MKNSSVLPSVFLMLLMAARTQAAPADVDPGFNPGFGADAPVHAIALQPDGKVLVGGEFYYFNLSNLVHIARLNSNGTLDTSFNIGLGARGTGPSAVYSIALQPDGKSVLGGSFSSFNGTNRFAVARLNADGSLEQGFDPGEGPNAAVFSVLVQTNGRVVLGGAFSAFNETSRNGIARLMPDGQPDPSFDPGLGAGGAYPWIDAMILLSDGKLLVGGYFTSMNGTNRNYLARLNANGSLDLTFDPEDALTFPVYALALQPDGRILVGGRINIIGGMVSNNLVRLNVDGSVDPSFHPGLGPNQAVLSLAVQPDGHILAGGDFTSFNGTNQAYLVRLYQDGSLDTSFRPYLNGDVQAFALQPDGKILLGGAFGAIDSWSRGGIARLMGTPVELNIRVVSGQVVLDWGDPKFSLQSASNVDGPFANVPAAASPYTNDIAAPRQFFRLVYP